MLGEFIRIFGEETVQEFKIVVDTIREKREKHLYEVIGTLNSTLGLFYVKKSGWVIKDVVDEVIDNIERKIIQKKEKLKTKRNLPANV